MTHHYSNNDGLYCESAKDPNVIFAELDKGLHSVKVGEQCGAIVRYPQLFENYPFPIMIKSSFVKLANVFRSGTNFLRLCVFQVTQQCSQHLEKIGNVDDIVKCIHSVMHSNDPVARALTLKMLGSMACIISEQKFVHHSILSSLDSHDQVEVLAALFAASQFAGRSKSFSGSVCTKLTEMIERLSVPVDMKFKFMFVCRNMNCDSETLEKVRTLCLSVLRRYPSCRFVVSVLHTMTLLSKRSLVHLSHQVELLLEYLKEDVRTSVKKLALKDLKLLACCAPHVWKNYHVHIIFEFVKASQQQQQQEDLLVLALEVLSKLSSTIAVYLLAENLDSPHSPMVNCCHMACLHDNSQISVRGIRMFVYVVSYEISLLSGAFLKDDDEKPYVLEDLCNLIEMKMIMSVTRESSEDLFVLKECSISTLKLCKVCPSLVNQFAKHVVYLLMECNKDAKKSIALCELLSAFHCEFDEMPAMGSSLKSLLLRSMDSFQTIGTSEETLILSIIRLMLQARDKTSLRYTKEEMKEVKDGEEEDDKFIMNCLKKVSPWTSFKVARQAARFGSHKLASEIFSDLMKLSLSEYHCFWLEGLTNYCAGEALLQVDDNNSRSLQVGNLLKANEFLQSAFAAFKAATTSANWFMFQTDYVSLRSKTLRCLLQIIHTCTSYQTIPPPAIASTLADSTGLESHKVQHLLDQLKNCKKMMENLESGYESLYYKCFDADSQTLDHISLLLDMCQLLSQVLDTFFGMNERTEFKPSSIAEEFFKQKVGDTREWKHWLIVKKEILKILKDMNLLKHKAIKFIEEVAILCSKMAICLPRFFFQKLQSTDIKLAVSPAMKNQEDPILVKCDCNVVVKVEGIVNRVGKKMSAHHNASKVQLTLKSELATKQTVSSKISNEFVEACSMQGDYFCHKFILSFSSSGIHQVSIEVGILDDSGNIWFTGTKSFLLFQAYDEAAFRQQQLQQINAL